MSVQRGPPAVQEDTAEGLGEKTKQTNRKIGRSLEWLEDEPSLLQKGTGSSGKKSESRLVSRDALYAGPQFVSETGTAKPSGVYRSLIRSQARLKRPFVARKKLPAKDRDADERSNRELGVIPGVGPRIGNMQLTAGPETEAMDPFFTLPVTKNGRTEELIIHYEKVYRQSFNPINPRKEWMPFAMSDPALLHATLFISALSHCLLHGKASSAEIFYHKGQTIRLVNERLRMPKHVASDATISAITCLTALENMTGNATTIKIHMSGLEAMVKSRGGLEALGSHGLPRKLIYWIDCCASLIMEIPPRFEEPCMDEDGSLLYPEEHSALALRYQNKLFNLTGSMDLSEETIYIYRELRNLTIIKEMASFKHPVESGELVSYSDMIGRLERRVLKLVQTEDLKSPSVSMKSSIYPLFGYATIIHIYFVLRDVPRGVPFLRLISGRIQNLLQPVDLCRLQMQYPEMMLWILLLGGLGGIGSPEQKHFASLLADLCFDVGILGGNQIAAALEDFLWTELYRSPVTVGFWRDVAMAEGLVEGAYDVRRLKDYVAVAHFHVKPEIV